MLKNMHRLLLPLLAITFVLPTALHAEEQGFTLEQAVMQALTANPELSMATSDITVLQAKRGQIRAREGVTVDVVGSSTFLSAQPVMRVDPMTMHLPAALGGATMQVPIPDMPLANHNVTLAELTVKYPLYTGGRISSALEQVECGTQTLNEIREAKREEIALATTRAYLSTVLAQRVAVVADEAYEIAKLHEGQTQKLLDNGQVAKYDLIRAQTEVANLKRRQLDAHNQVELARAYLQAILGTSEQARATLTTPLDGQHKYALTMMETSDSAQNSSHALLALDARDKLYVAAEDSARADTHPAVGALATRELYINDQPFTTPKYTLGLMFTIPLFDGGMSKGKIAEQEALRQRNRQEVRRVKDGLELEARKYYLDYQNAEQALSNADQAVTLAQESLRLATRRFAEGQGTSLEMMDANLALLLAKTNREQALYQHELAYYGLKKVTGGIISEFTATEVGR